MKILVLILISMWTTAVYAQPYSPEQKQVIKTFRQEYFAPAITFENKIPLADFMEKTKPEKSAFIKTWAQKRYQKILKLETNLNAQMQRVAQVKTIVETALANWQ